VRRDRVQVACQYTVFAQLCDDAGDRDDEVFPASTPWRHRAVRVALSLYAMKSDEVLGCVWMACALVLAFALE
jgi:hypothetical protein